MGYDLSILIPARNEHYYDLDLLGHTVRNVLDNTSNRCQIIVVLDGAWSLHPLPTDPRLTVIHHSRSIGQRAATNEAARIATGEWVCKLDAHCAVDKDFDTNLIAGMEADWTVVPGQFNLQAFQWKCKKCGWLRDQSPKPEKCGSCDSQFVKLVPLWFPRDGRENSNGVGGKRVAYTHSWRFDTNLDFQYFGAYAADEKHCKKHGFEFRPEAQGEVHNTMSLLGACWAMRRDRYFYLEPCDERFGSWGDMGTEISCKSWLSGGRLVVNQNTWFAHFFRVGGIGFPYEGGGRKERAKARGKELWLTNSWPKQVYPLSWLIEKFKPLPDWHTNNHPMLVQVSAASKNFRPLVVSGVGGFTTNPTLSHKPTVEQDNGVREQVASDAVSLSLIDHSRTVPPHGVLQVGNQLHVDRVAAGAVSAEMIDNKNVTPSPFRQRLDQPCVDDSVNQVFVPCITDTSIAAAIDSSDPVPAASSFIDNNARKNTDDVFDSKMNGEILLNSHDSASDAGLGSGSELRVERDSDSSIVPRKTCLYYTCNSHDETLELAARANLKAATNGHEVGCVSLQRTDFGDWNIVVDREKSGTTMHYQILEGLKRSTADYVFLCESDLLYHPTHFHFTPPRDDTFYYNINVWRVRWSDGHAVRTDNLQQVSGICASRKLLLEHYRKRIEMIERSGGKFDVKHMAYEPGTRGKFGDERIANWESPFPNIDITGHGQTLTVPHFSVDSFRNKKFAQGWQETDDEIAGWGKLSGRLQEFLADLAQSS